MYAKIFSQIYDGTLCTRGPWQALVTFQQLLVLADKNGVVDMTASAIARRTTIPLDIIETGIAALIEDDPESRTPTENGRRIVPLSSERGWGWAIVNYKHYRAMKREEERREYHRNYWKGNRGVDATQHKTQTLNQLNQNQPIAEAEAEAVKDKTLRVSSSPPAKTIPPCPVQKILDAYHRILPELSQVVAMNPYRRGMLATRWRELHTAGDFSTQEEGIKAFERYFEIVRKSDFLMGKTNPSRDRKPFKADFEWLIRPQNFLKVIEGKYHGNA